MASGIRAGALLALAVCGLMGCGHPARPQPVTHTVTIDAVHFQPATITVRVGDTVVWVNKDPFPHTVTAASGNLSSPDIGASDSWRWTATSAGDLPYVCKYHPTMTGTVTVAP
ncbi:MAG: cupredoxin family copper-binding protein [Acidobacteriota bacterium]